MYSFILNESAKVSTDNRYQFFISQNIHRKNPKIIIIYFILEPFKGYIFEHFGVIFLILKLQPISCYFTNYNKISNCMGKPSIN